MEARDLPSTPMPLLMLTPGDDGEPPHHKRKMEIVPHTPTTAFSSFRLPDDWIVEGRPRTSGSTAGIIDRYYYEPGTGRQFRSLRSVEKYLMEANENMPSPEPSKPSKRIMMLRWAERELHHKKEMAIVSHTTTSSFKVPDDWVVKLRRRTSGYSAGRIDKYYYEPSTGRQFRSLRAVEKYLTEEKDNTPTHEALKQRNHIPMLRFKEKDELHYNTEMAIVAPTTISRTSPFELPDDWVVKEMPRSSGIIDKYYYEPGTGQQFRSLISVERYLTEARENAPTPEALKPGNDIMPSQNSGFQEKNISSVKVKTSSFDFANPPVKIKWVLTGPGGDTWNPFMGDSVIPDSVKQQWAKTFVLSLNCRNFNAPSSKADV
ncbi:hypothetical protein L1049_013843 [Liquidambar formosana]|uniref:MBD domain-containing protein n=1 Tax=Liquidambar formosana TaxID=63359 RepID=A0AAP0RQU7_LIQFO